MPAKAAERTTSAAHPVKTRRPEAPVARRLVVPAAPSGTFDTKTAARNAASIAPPTARVEPSTNDSGTPSSRAPRNIAHGDPSSGRPSIAWRSAPPSRSIVRSAT